MSLQYVYTFCAFAGLSANEPVTAMKYELPPDELNGAVEPAER